MLVEAVFLVAGVLALVSAVMVLRVKELVHAAMWLALMLLAIAGVFLTLGAEFLAIIQVFVYIGAVITLILFTIMLTTSDEKASFLDLQLPPGVTVEKVEDLHTAVPSFTGAGPYKDLETTNPRRPLRTPENLYGVGLADNDYGTEYTPRDKKEGK